MTHVLPIQTYAMFADESGISNDRFTVVGGITVHRDRLPAVYANMKAFRRDTGISSELKYRSLIEQFFALNYSKQIEFHAVAFDNHKWNHKRFNKSDSDIGLSKMYYQLILHRLVYKYGDQNSLFVCLDHRTSSTKLADLQNMLNRAANRDLGLSYSPLRQLESRDSKTEELLQLNDVILGAIAAIKNARHLLAGGRVSKKRLAELVFEKSGLPPLEKNSPKSMTHFSFWNKTSAA